MSLVTVNTPMPIATVLPDGRQDRYIKARLYNFSNGNLLAEYDLVHGYDGIYLKNDVLAPAVGLYLIKYVVYKNAAYTQLDTKYSQAVDTVRVEDFENLIDDNDGQII